MLQAYSSNLSVAANTAFPFNSATVDKGRAEVLAAPASIQLNQRGVYFVQVDGYGTGGATGDDTVQLYVNGVAQPQAISSFATAAATIANFNFNCLIQVANNNCPCNCITSPTILQVMNGDSALTDSHINIIVTKLC